MKHFTWPRYRLLASGMLLVLSLFRTRASDTSRPGVTKDNFAKLQKGMSEKEVEGILGKAQWGSIHDGGMRLVVGYKARPSPPPPWAWEEISVAVVFDPNGLAEAFIFVKTKIWAELFRGWRAWLSL